MIKDRRVTADVDDTRCSCNFRGFTRVGEKGLVKLIICACGSNDRKRAVIIKRDKIKRYRLRAAQEM